jgi:hypothetical protein
VLAHWHGQHRTDGFATTVGALKKLAKEWMSVDRKLAFYLTDK